jgi:zinc transporter 1/2/3
MPNRWGGWAFWFLSVFFVSTLVHLLGGRSGPNKFTRTLETRVSSSKSPSSMCLSCKVKSVTASLKYQPKKRDRCASGSAQPDYDMPFHVGGLFLVLFVSSTACAFPILVIKFPRLRIPASFLFCAKHFGTGVLIATAFVHLLPTAFQSLNDPCLPSFWNHDYPAIPGAIMLASVFFVAVIEMVFSPAQQVCGGNEGVEHVSRREMAEPEIDSQQDTFTTDPGRGEMRRAYSDGMRDMGRPVPLGGRATSISRTLSQYREEIQRTDETSSPGKHHSNEPSNDSQEIGSTDPHHLTPDQTRKKAVMQVFLLEMGILFHSIFIGMSLAVTVGNDFVVLLIAIIFHQTFEGLALGVRIANISWPNHTPQPWVMAVAYGCTTPLGQAIGIATHTLYSPDSEIGLLVVGVMNAISAGFLVFASLVELLSEDFLSDESWKVLRGRRRVFALLLVFFGAFGMSVVGAWA